MDLIRAEGLDFNVVSDANDILITVRTQEALVYCFCPQRLYGFHDRRRPRQKRVSEILRPIEMIVHHDDETWNTSEILYAGVPTLFLKDTTSRPVRRSAIQLQPFCRLCDFQRVCRGNKHLCQQAIRI